MLRMSPVLTAILWCFLFNLISVSNAHANTFDCQAEPLLSPAVQPETLDYAKFLSKRGKFYHQCRLDYARAKQDFTDSYTIASKASPAAPVDTGVALSNLARLYMEWNQHLEQVEDKFKQAATLLHGTARHFEALTHLGDFHAQQSNWSQAQTYYLQALQHLDYPQIPPAQKAIVFNNLSKVYREQSQYSTAAHYLEESAALLPNTSTDYAINRYNLGQNAHAHGDDAKAKQYYNASLSLYQQQPPSPNREQDIAQVSTRLAELALQAGDIAETKRLLDIAAPTYRSPKSAYLPNGTAFLSATMQQDVQRFARLQLQVATQSPVSPAQAPGLADAFWALQHLHGLQRMQNLHQTVLRWSASNPVQAQAIQDLWQTQQTLTHLEAQHAAQLGTPAAEQLAAAINTQQQTLLAQDSQLRREFPAYRQLLNPNALSLSDAQTHLRDHEALMTWVIDHDAINHQQIAYLLVVRSKTAPRLHRLALPAHFSESLAHVLRPMYGVSETAQPPSPFAMAQAEQLYQTLFAPAMPDLHGVKHIIAVTDDELQRLPLHLLVIKSAPAEAYRDAHWLMQAYTFAYLPSVQALANLRTLPAAPQTDARHAFLGIGAPQYIQPQNQHQPLPGAAEELEHQRQRLGGESQFVLTGKAATEQALQQLSNSGELQQFRVVSLATHAYTPSRLENAEARLELAPTAQADGQLTASEIANLQLKADWVLLSACSTGKPTDLNDGMSALVKAFFTAGARSVLASHWDIDSATTEQWLGTVFDQLQQQPQQRAQALQHAMQTLLDSEAYNHPFYWGAFSLYGDGG